MTNPEPDAVRDSVREAYASVSRAAESCCESAGEAAVATEAAGKAQTMGYSDADLSAAPEGANLGLGCGNPVAIASLAAGEVVLDLGSGGGFDCFLAAREVGTGGRVIGVDMTAEMVARARANARETGAQNVEFRLGEIEHLPVADDTADVVMSNCVINLSPEKAQVFREAHRALKPGGRLSVSDIVATSAMPQGVRDDLTMISGCIGGAAGADEVRDMLRHAGFVDIRITVNEASRAMIADWAPGSGLEAHIASALIEARKPA